MSSTDEGKSNEQPSFQPASSVLARFTMLDPTRVRAGPSCVRRLGDRGADVIEIEMPEGPDAGATGPNDVSARHEPDFRKPHRDKRSIIGAPGRGPPRVGVPSRSVGRAVRRTTSRGRATTTPSEKRKSI